MSPYKDPEKRKAYQKKYQKKWYLKNKEHVIKRQKEKRHEIKEMIIKYKEVHPCILCGENRHYVLDFHHPNKEEKDKSISYMARKCYSMGAVINEIEKCIIFCANCHRELHYRQRIKNTP